MAICFDVCYDFKYTEGDKTMQGLLNSLAGLLNSLLELILLLLDPKILIPIIFFIIIFSKKSRKPKKKKKQNQAEEKEYISSTYYQITQHPYSLVKEDLGRYGEYLTYKYLKVFETNGAKFLFNIYIPKQDGETTEIDVLMVCKKGLFVFESKNYSGWIFGNESQENWYQTLPTSRNNSHKELFYNPIMQNRSHIKNLKAFLDTQAPIWSIVVFSERCTLKSIQVYSDDVRVIKRYDVALAVSDICNKQQNDLLTENDITDIYNKLFPYTQTDESLKTQHITNIHNNLKNHTIQQISLPPKNKPTQEEPTAETTDQQSN